ncbi:MAG: hypothetical protein HQ541_09360 [Mariniphaga sp.]|nr:hypothetical protein [Mariniphaga sp.]
MKINLEKYLKEKRLLLDVEQPDENSVWEGIKAGMVEERKIIPNWFWKVAAVFLLGVLTTYIVMNETGIGSQKVITLSDVSEELGKQEAEFKMVAEKKWEEVKPLISKNKGDFQFLLNELDELETIQKIYQQDLNEIGANEYIIRALLDYYEKKIKILDRLLLETQKQNNHEEQITL